MKKTAPDPDIKWIYDPVNLLTFQAYPGSSSIQLAGLNCPNAEFFSWQLVTDARQLYIEHSRLPHGRTRIWWDFQKCLFPLSSSGHKMPKSRQLWNLFTCILSGLTFIEQSPRRGLFLQSTISNTRHENHTPQLHSQPLKQLHTIDGLGRTRHSLR